MEYYYKEELKKYNKKFCEDNKETIELLSEKEKEIFNRLMNGSIYCSNDDVNSVNNLNEYMQSNYSALIKLLIPDEFREQYAYILDNFINFQYETGWTRRSFRWREYSVFTGRAIGLACVYYYMGFRGTKRNEMDKYVSCEDCKCGYALREEKMNGLDGYIIAACIDEGDEKVINSVADIMKSENNTNILSTDIIRGVFCSKNEELHDLMCNLLVAARLSEGLRQAICENADFGTAEAFKKIVKTIIDNNLVRFSSIKRAIGTWTGICDYDENPNRLAEKILKNIPYVLESHENALEKINTDDPVDIYMGIWGIGFYDFFEAVKVILNIIEKNDRNFAIYEPQMLVMGYFLCERYYSRLSIETAGLVLEKVVDNYKIFSLYKSCYLYRFNVDKRTPNYIVDMLSDKEAARKHFCLLEKMYNAMSEKEYEFNPILYPWFSTSISKGEILYYMARCARISEDDEKMDFICDHLGEAKAGYTEYKHRILSVIGEKITTTKQRNTLINAAADKESYTRECAVSVLKKMQLTDEEYKVIEGFTKYKNSKLRCGVIDLLKQRGDEGIKISACRMISQKNENIKLAALDLLEYAIEKYPDINFDSIKEEITNIACPSENLKILIDKLTKGSDETKASKENNYNLYSSDVQMKPIDFEPDLDVVRNYFSVSKQEVNEMYLELKKLINENAGLEYKNCDQKECILGNMGSFLDFHIDEMIKNGKKLEIDNQLAHLWDKFYDEVIKSPKRLFCFDFCGVIVSKDDPVKQGNYDNELRKAMRYAFGELGEYDAAKELEKENIMSYEFRKMKSDVVKYLIIRNGFSIPLDVLQNLVGYLALNVVKKDLLIEGIRDTYRIVCDGSNSYKMHVFISELDEKLDDDFEVNFYLLRTLYKKVVEYSEDYGYHSCGKIPLEYYLKAYRLGIISEEIIYKDIFELINIEYAFLQLSNYFNNTSWKEKNKRLFQDGKKVAQTLLDVVLDTELKRGDSKTEFSDKLRYIRYVEGTDRFGEIVKALSNEKLVRSYYCRDVSKNKCLCHLLNVSYPSKEDTFEKFKSMIDQTQITDDRLIEIAMFAPQWIDYIEKYLQIDGLKAGCYYFIAHSSEDIDDKTEAIIAKYTPFSKEELNGGCFDVKWFYEIYRILGEKNFDRLYKASKYAFAGNRHVRARKYADAALGKLDIEDVKQQISEKRNKDLLMAFAIIPSKNKADILDRYEFIQKFLKESRQFGAARRESEASAVAYALKNLAVTAGYSDDMRLILSMETEIVTQNDRFFEENIIKDYSVRINVDIQGRSSLIIKKGEKELKSVPAAIKKNEEFMLIKEFGDKLKQQYSRTVKMFEEAMENRDGFGFKELTGLCNNPVTKAIVENLVFVVLDDNKKTGLLTPDGLCDCGAHIHNISNEEMLRVAHPFDLYSNKVWSQYQQMILELGNGEGRRQPFRQVFRELYVKLDEEADKKVSLMFAGNQIQTNRTIGALKNRRWIADYEDGLQKIYYKDNIIASIYAKADWFSPADVEAPVLEGVYFYDRKTYGRFTIASIPDILYSEVMRDVDLAVSVAHVGGVDPVTCHSTIEMRSAILQFNLKLFGIDNVQIQKNHAIIEGTHGKYTVHLGSGVIHKMGGHMINVIAVSDKRTSKIFLPFIDEDPKTAEIMTKVLTFASDDKIKDPYIMDQIMR